MNQPTQSIMSKQTYRVCFCCRRRFKLAVSEAPPEIRALFERYSENGIMTASHLRSFMVEVQRDEKTTEEEAQLIIDGLKHLSIFHRRGFNLDSFFKFLFSDNNPPLLPSRGVNQIKPFFLFFFFFCTYLTLINKLWIWFCYLDFIHYTRNYY